jgi:hypothetical protein
MHFLIPENLNPPPSRAAVLEVSYSMRKEPRQKTLDSNTEREMEDIARQSKQKGVRQQAPLKEHGQPAWRDVKPG